MGKSRDDRISASVCNPSTSFIKGTIFRKKIVEKISRPRLISIRWNFVRGRGTKFKEISGRPILIVELSK